MDALKGADRRGVLVECVLLRRELREEILLDNSIGLKTVDWWSVRDKDGSVNGRSEEPLGLGKTRSRMDLLMSIAFLWSCTHLVDDAG